MNAIEVVTVGGMGVASRIQCFDWTGPTLWRCPRCGHEVTTAAAAPRCRLCGFRESD